MKYYPLLFLLFLLSCSVPQKCYEDKSKRVKSGGFEIIDMGGTSVFSMEDMFKSDFKFPLVGTKSYKKRYSNYYYTNFNLNLKLWSNDDTGKDRISVFYNEKLIFQEFFGEFEEVNINFINDNSCSQIKFIVDNPGTINNTPGAFSALIRIKNKK